MRPQNLSRLRVLCESKTDERHNINSVEWSGPHDAEFVQHRRMENGLLGDEYVCADALDRSLPYEPM